MIGAAEASLEASCRALRRGRLDAVLLHRAEHLDAWGGAVWRLLRQQRAAGLIGRLGVSLQSAQEAERVLGDPDIGQVQIPFNVLERRWEEAGIIESLRRRPEIVVHVRSVLLQGLLAGDPAACWPQIPGLDKDTLISALKESAASFGRQSLADLCLAFVRGQDWIDGIIIGMETAGEHWRPTQPYCPGPH